MPNRANTITTRRSLAAGLSCLALLGGVAMLLLWLSPRTENHAQANALRLDDIPVNGKRAYQYLKEICALGRRISGSPGMAKQQEMVEDHFRKVADTFPKERQPLIHWQKFRYAFPENDKWQRRRIEFANLIVQWHPQTKKRILLCAHYDTRPFPDEDPKNPRGLFIGANDGGSGTALLMELAHEMRDLKCNYGVDFVLFDAEEIIYDKVRDANYYFLGSTYFARQYRQQPPAYKYQWGVLLDMVADADLQIYKETNSLRTAKGRALVRDIWDTARRLGAREFISRARHTVRDDHLPLNNIARIPSCDIIDFDYPYWHKEGDTADKCSALSLAKVGWVVLEWLKTVK